jgi:hypothetical protein
MYFYSTCYLEERLENFTPIFKTKKAGSASGFDSIRICGKAGCYMEEGEEWDPLSQ